MSVMRTYVGTTPVVSDVILDQDGAPVTLTGATVTFRLRPDDASTPVQSLSGTPDPDQVAHKGKVTLQLGSPQMDARADFTTWWHVVFPTGAVLETDSNGLVVLTHDPVVGDGTAGPCSAWVSSDDVAALPGAGADVDYSDYALLASQLLYMWSGRQFPGNCTRTVRPSRIGCGCWATAWFRPSFVTWDLWQGRWWRGDGAFAKQDGCAPLSVVKLPGYVRSITEVMLNGLVVVVAHERVVEALGETLALGDRRHCVLLGLRVVSGDQTAGARRLRVGLYAARKASTERSPVLSGF